MSERASSHAADVAGVKYVPLDRHALIGMDVDADSCRRFIAGQNTALVNLAEFFYAQAYFPLVFIAQDDVFLPCAILGLKAGENLFVDEAGNWPASVYQPASLRRYPFYTQSLTLSHLEKEAGQLQQPIFVDEQALAKSDEPLFIANAVATPKWQSKESFISEYLRAEYQTLAFTRKLSALKLLEAFDAQVNPVQGEQIRLQGMYRVNEERLNKLPAKTVKLLMQSGYLSRIYAHLISLENFAKLLDRSAARKR